MFFLRMGWREGCHGLSSTKNGQTMSWIYIGWSDAYANGICLGRSR